jgi:hypothetical protein
MMKKGLKISGIIIASILGLIIAAGLIIPVLFKERIKEKVETSINGMVDAKVTFTGYRLSLFRSFPNVAFTLDGLTVTGTGQFEGDTLIAVGSAGLVFNLASLIGDKGYEIKSVTIDQPLLNAIVREDGSVNWDIMKDAPEKTAEETAEDQAEMSMKVALRKFALRDGRIYYSDSESDMSAAIEGLDFNLSGNMNGARTDLILDLTAGAVNFVSDNIQLLTDATISFNAGVDAAIDSMKFVLTDNLLKINDIGIEFSGMASMPGDDIGLDFKFGTPETSFKSLLSLVPAFYMKDFEGLKTGGTFSIGGTIKGIYSSADSTLPDFTLSLKVDNGELSYPGLPEKITAISIDGKVSADGKDMDNTVVDVNSFHFELAGNPFDMTMKLATPVSDPSIVTSAKGRIDLAKLQQAVPIDSVTLTGLIEMSLDLSGRMSMIENEHYDQFRAAGALTVSDMMLAMAGLPDFKISTASFTFSPAYAELTKLAASMGEKSDFSISGRIENYIPYLFSDGTVSGNLMLNSKQIDLNEILDIMPSDTTEADTTATGLIRVPENIDFTFRAVVGRLYYGRLSAENVKGNISVHDGVVSVNETGMQALGGSMLVNATYDTRDTLKPVVNANMVVNSVSIRDAFTTFNTVRSLMPAAAGLGGNVSVRMDFNSLISSSMMPLIGSLSGSGELSSESVQILESKTFDNMKGILKMNPSYTNIVKDVKAKFIINDGRLYVKPFDTKLGNIKLNVSGDQGLDRTINYLVKTEIPRAELGESAATLMGALSEQVAALGMTVTPPEIIKVNLRVGGTFSKPVITPVFAGGSGSGAVTAVTAAVKDEVAEKVNEAARDQADRILEEAGKKAQLVRDEAAASAKTIREEADLQGRKLIKEAESRGALAVIAARKAAEAVNKEADKRATQLETEADTRAEKIIAEARVKADELLK